MLYKHWCDMILDATWGFYWAMNGIAIIFLKDALRKMGVL
jgi:hypothetical protein